MDTHRLPLLTPTDLRALGALGAPAAAAGTDVVAPDCPRCRALRCPGWEPLPPGFDEQALEALGTLRDPRAEDEPTVEEYHPAGTRFWSAEAPIAPRFHPYNRCSVHACTACRRPFLRYTEYGGYYMEQRVRELDPRLVVDA